jgi:hypothetical protein
MALHMVGGSLGVGLGPLIAPLLNSDLPSLAFIFSFGQQGSSIIQPVAGDFMDAIGIDGVFNSIAYISVGLSVLTVFLLFKNRGKANSHRR